MKKIILLMVTSQIVLVEGKEEKQKQVISIEGSDTT